MFKNNRKSDFDVNFAHKISKVTDPQSKNHFKKILDKNMKYLNNSDKKTYIKNNFKEVYKQIEKIIKKQKVKKF